MNSPVSVSPWRRRRYVGQCQDLKRRTTCILQRFVLGPAVGSYDYLIGKFMMSFWPLHGLCRDGAEDGSDRVAPLTGYTSDSEPRFPSTRGQVNFIPM